MKRLAWLLLPLTIAGCAEKPADPLFDSPMGQRITCQAVRPVQAKDALSMIPFNCGELQISASLSELRDAGWRLESVDIGNDILVENVLSTEVSITVRKVY
ncbi:MAG: hypothetical protein J6V64_06075 [Burkholderiaceae bacterium]|nr:hypothetical protein [Burkholderiaceae bacterium]